MLHSIITCVIRYYCTDIRNLLLVLSTVHLNIHHMWQRLMQWLALGNSAQSLPCSRLRTYSPAMAFPLRPAWKPVDSFIPDIDTGDTFG